MNKPLLSIAVPAYNVALYLKDTITSVTKSKYTSEIEIIIVNDGSTDNTLKIAQDLAKQSACIRIVDKENGGHGSGINVGLKEATGKYFRLLDGDDWFDTAEFDKYIESLRKEDSDLILTDFVECLIKSNLNRPTSNFSNLEEYKMQNLNDIDFISWCTTLPTTTIKTDLLKQLKIKIDEHCFYVDQEYNLACYIAAQTVTYYPLFIYQYRLEREGQSMEKENIIKNIKSHEMVCKHLLSEFAKHKKNLSTTKNSYISERIITSMCHLQYQIAIEWSHSRKDFVSFDNFIQKYPDFYNSTKITSKITNFHRLTRGYLIKFDSTLRKIASIINKIHQ